MASGHFGADIFGFVSELFGNDVDCLGVHSLVYAHHNAYAHAGSYDLVHRNVHHCCKLVGRNKFRKLEYLALRSHFRSSFFGVEPCVLAFLAAVFCASRVFPFACKACQCLLNLLCYVLVRNVRLQRLELAYFFLSGAWRRCWRCAAGCRSLAGVLRRCCLLVALRRLRPRVPFPSGCVFALSALCGGCILLVLFFAFLALFFFCFFLRAHGLVYRRKVYCPQYFRGGKFYLRVKLEDTVFTVPIASAFLFGCVVCACLLFIGFFLLSSSGALFFVPLFFFSGLPASFPVSAAGCFSSPAFASGEFCLLMLLCWFGFLFSCRLAFLVAFPGLRFFYGGGGCCRCFCFFSRFCSAFSCFCSFRFCFDVDFASPF